MRRQVPSKGEVWRHFKGVEYRIDGIAFTADAARTCVVVYTSPSCTTWTRPLNEFMDLVPHPLIQDELVLRFEAVKSAPQA